MHISDGIISTPVCIAAHAASAGLLYVTGRKADAGEIPKMGITGAAIFVASLIQFPLAGTSVHLGLFGLSGILLGKRSFPVIYTALLLQAAIFNQGGLLSLGLNSLNMGAGAWVAWLIWRSSSRYVNARALMAGAAGILIPAGLMITEFRITGYGSGIAMLFLIYCITAVIEAGVSISAVRFILKVKPDIINSCNT